MHELAVTQSILDIALKHAGGRAVRQIHLVIGQFSSIVDDSVQFYWDIIAKGTLAEGAQLRFERIRGEMRCSGCGHVFRPGSESFICPACGGSAVQVSKGREFYMDSIDVA